MSTSPDMTTAFHVGLYGRDTKQIQEIETSGLMKAPIFLEAVLVIQIM